MSKLFVELKLGCFAKWRILKGKLEGFFPDYQTLLGLNARQVGAVSVLPVQRRYR